MTNFLRVSDHIATSGQPSADDFRQIAELGYTSVINLALSTASNAIEHEGDVVTGHGMSYVHIPVRFDRPQVSQFELFAAVLRQQAGSRVWVHCAMNMRVSAFMYLYHTVKQDWPESRARELLLQVWEPDPVWADFIEQVLQSRNEAANTGN
ncbi:MULTISPECIES: protein tyrosine phosphatase family protein [Microbulbifer]|uniref:protein tyrosine phosphatase family protein n=1 Tax=Microbulbifer TaxID=48073 RepID=UPI0021020E54|nr:protein tyrosine phosphatase family protein [Microbulbifer sp. YPW16]